MSSHPALIAVDWGTSSMRATLLGAQGSVLATGNDGPGILTVENGTFRRALDTMIAPWRERFNGLPIVLSGMVGSRQGWREVPYLACPADAAAVARALVQIDTIDGAPVMIVPGLVANAAGAAPDVMRGEETQIFGALASSELPAVDEQDRRFVLPGTHSKWVTVRDGAVVDFATFMTGEVFAALRNHTILGRTMPPAGSAFDAAAFAKGVGAGAAEGPAGALLYRLFGVRTLALFEKIAAPALESYLSGLLIGAECATAAGAAPPVIVGNAVLADRYRRALDTLGVTSTIAPPDCAAIGAWRLAAAAGLVG